MNGDQFDAVLRRLEKVERANRRMKILGLVSGSMAVIAVGAGAVIGGPQDTVNASRVNILDGEGNPRLVIGYNPQDNNSYINFWDGNRKLRVNLWAGGGNGFIHADADGNVQRVW